MYVVYVPIWSDDSWYRSSRNKDVAIQIAKVVAREMKHDAFVLWEKWFNIFGFTIRIEKKVFSIEAKG